MMLPLSGIKVIEIAQNLAGPFTGQILANLGADVVKLERPDGGDDARYWGTLLTPDASYTFHAMNYNKRGFALDLRDPAAIAWLKQYIGGCDVLVQNMRPGVMEDLGLDAQSMRAAHPRLVYCSLWAFGNKGPMKMKPGYEPVVQAFAGLFSVNGAPEAPPTRIGVQLLDLGTGMWAALGCVAAPTAGSSPARAASWILRCSRPRSAGSRSASAPTRRPARCRSGIAPDPGASSCSRRSRRAMARSWSRRRTIACS